MEEQSEQDPPAQNQSSNETHHKVHRLSRIFVIFSALIGIASSIFFFYFYLTYQPPQTPLPISINQTKTVDEMANWKVYKNNRYQFEFKYPQSWTIKEDVLGSVSIVSPDREDSPDSGFPSKGSEINMDAEVTTVKSLDEIYEAYQLKNKTYIEKGITKIISKENITLNNMKALKVISQTIESPEGYEIHVLNKQTHITIQFWQVGTNYEPIFDQILSTFKFLDENDETATWKTYRNEKLGIGFNHPNETTPFEAPNGSISITYNEPGAPDGCEFCYGYKLRFKKGKLGSENTLSLIKKKESEVKTLYREYAQILVPITSITVSSYQGYTFAYIFQIREDWIYISDNNNYMEIQKTVSDPNNKGHEKTVDQILSTFKFTN